MWFIYPFLIFFFVIIYLPKFLYEYFFKKKYRGVLLKRLGFIRENFRQGSPTIWIHAVSVGEVKAVTTLVEHLKEKYPISSIIVSTVTQTGHKEAKKVLKKADHIVFLPLDFDFILSRFLKNLKIDLLLLIETDFWPNFLKQCKKRGASVVLVNGKISENSYKRIKLMPPVKQWYFSNVDYFLVQDEAFRSRFIDLQVPPERIKIIPNIKLDDRFEELSEEELDNFRKQYDIQDISIVIGSSHEGEEKVILNQILPLFNIYSRLKVIIVPRHPERFSEVEALIKSFNLSYSKFSDQKSNHAGKKILLVDAMGKLRQFYQLTTLAIVAGSYNSKVGGHNILEPLWYSTPCIFGPHMQTQAQFTLLVLKAKAGRQVPADDIQKTLQELINDPFKLKQMGRRGKDIFLKASGGTDKTIRFIENILEKKSFKA